LTLYHLRSPGLKTLNIVVLKGFTAVVDPRAVGKNLAAFILVRAQPKAYPSMFVALKTIA
jgi:DNA-binding Lrp family transcriptional regulator